MQQTNADYLPYTTQIAILINIFVCQALDMNTNIFNFSVFWTKCAINRHITTQKKLNTERIFGYIVYSESQLFNYCIEFFRCHSFINLGNTIYTINIQYEIFIIPTKIRRIN